MKCFVCLVLTFFFVIILTNPANAVNISGTIVNMAEVARYVDDESYLQIVAVPADEKFSGKYNHGRIIYDSDLPKAAFSKNGKFNIAAPGLPPGNYIVSGQNLKPFGQGNGGDQRLALKGEKKIFLIVVPAGAGQKTLNLGELWMSVPK